MEHSLRYLAVFFGRIDLDGLDQNLVKQHFDWLAAQQSIILDAGGLRAEPTEGFVGAAWVIAADSLDAARDIMAQDPFVAAGLWVRSDCYAWGYAFRATPNDLNGECNERSI